MILRAKKRLEENMKRNKRNGMVMFVYMNAVNYSEFQPLNAHVQHKK